MSYFAEVKFGFPLREDLIVLEEGENELLPGVKPPIFGRFERRELAVAEVYLEAGERRRLIMTVTSAEEVREERYVDTQIDLSARVPYDLMLSEPKVKTTIILRMIRR